MAEAPISTSLAALTTVVSLAVSYNAARPRSLFKSLFHPIYFSSHIETICGLALMYKLRLFEQQWGSKKYSNFILITQSLSSLISCGLFAVCRRSISSLPCGPHGVIVASLVQFYLDVPIIATSEHASITALFCLLATKMSLSSRLSAFVTTISGLLAGMAYRHPRIRSLTIPGTGYVADTCKHVVQLMVKFMESSHRGTDSESLSQTWTQPATYQPIAPHVIGRQLLEGGHGTGGQVSMLGSGAAPGYVQSQEARRAALETLAGMGFHDTRRNEQLLSMHGGDLARVIEHLIH